MTKTPSPEQKALLEKYIKQVLGPDKTLTPANAQKLLDRFIEDKSLPAKVRKEAIEIAQRVLASVGSFTDEEGGGDG